MAGLRGTWAVLLGASMTSACIFAEPPERTPRQTPIFLDMNAAAPSVTRLLSLQLDEASGFSVPFRSEDAGEDVWFGVHRNFGLAGAEKERIGRVPASTLEDDTRQFTFDYRAGGAEECVQLTLVACHFSNFLLNDFRCSDSAEDVGLATWWFKIGDIDSAPSLEGCPQPNGSATP